MSEVLIADLPLNMSEVKGHREVAAYLDVCCLLCDLLSFFLRCPVASCVCIAILESCGEWVEVNFAGEALGFPRLGVWSRNG